MNSEDLRVLMVGIEQMYTPPEMYATPVEDDVDHVNQKLEMAIGKTLDKNLLYVLIQSVKYSMDMGSKFQPLVSALAYDPEDGNELSQYLETLSQPVHVIVEGGSRDVSSAILSDLVSGYIENSDDEEPPELYINDYDAGYKLRSNSEFQHRLEVVREEGGVVVEFDNDETKKKAIELFGLDNLSDVSLTKSALKERDISDDLYKEVTGDRRKQTKREIDERTPDIGASNWIFPLSLIGLAAQFAGILTKFVTATATLTAIGNVIWAFGLGLVIIAGVMSLYRTW